MLRLTNRFFLIAVGGLTSIAFGIGLRSLHPAEPDTRGRFTSRQILAKTRTLSPWVPALATAATYTVERLPLHKGFTFWKPGWMVECFNAENRYIGHLLWDAETGRLLEVSNQPAAPLAVAKPFALPQVTGMARDWLSALLPPERDAPWRLAEPPEHYERVWTVRFLSQNRLLTLRMDEAGNLLFLCAL